MMIFEFALVFIMIRILLLIVGLCSSSWPELLWPVTSAVVILRVGVAARGSHVMTMMRLALMFTALAN